MSTAGMPASGTASNKSRNSVCQIMLYFFEQFLNGIQLGMLLFLLAAGLTLIFGIMDLVNLAHGSLYMLGAYFAATFADWTDSFLLGALLALAAAAATGMLLEVIAVRRLYGRSHLDHVLGTFGLLLFFNELVRLIWGSAGMTLSLPSEMLNAVEVLPGLFYPLYRLVIIGVTLAVAVLLYLLIMRTRLGMLIRAGASNREMVGALGVNIKLLYTMIFGLGAALAGFAGLMQAPILTVQIGMGENILIAAFVVVTIGGIGSIRGAFVASLLVGLADTVGRTFVPDLLRAFLSESASSSLGRALSSMMIYLVMALVLIARPEGLFPAAGK
jgi:branched-chain amino acid transport system permease protein